MNILVFGVGGPTPRAFVRSVRRAGKAGVAFRFFGADCNPKAIGLYDRELFDDTYLVPRAGEPGYWDAINRIVEKAGIEAAIIIPETEAIEWAKNSSRLNRSVRTHLPDPALAEMLYDKAKVHQMLESTGLVPRHLAVDPASAKHEELTKALGAGYWIRGTQGAGGLGALLSAMEEFISPVTNCERLGAASRHHAESKYDVRKVNDALLSAFSPLQ